jgi:uncharacterized protein YuzE
LRGDRFTDMQVRFDPETDVAYFALVDSPVEDSEEVRPGVVLDFDVDGRIVGIEVLGAKALLPAALLVQPISAE